MDREALKESVMCLVNCRWYSFTEIADYDDNGEPEWVYLADDDGFESLFHVDAIEMVEEIG